MRTLVLLGVVGLLLPACDDDAGVGPVTFATVERLIVIGDNVASSPSYPKSYVGLLHDNDDALFPAFKGRDLSTKIPSLDFVRLDRGGDSYNSLAAAKTPFCTCVGAACKAGAPCIDSGNRKPTLVIVQLGANDVLATFLKLLTASDLKASIDKAVAQFRADAKKVLAVAADTATIGSAPLVFVTNIYDPSDAVGDLAKIASAVFPIPNADRIDKKLVLSAIKSFNDAIAAEAKAVGATLVDVHRAFLGHGYHFDDKAHAHYVSKDATRWLRGAIDPNQRGAHEIRRALWAALTRESIAAIPTLPPDSIAGLPAVPKNGWAKAVTSSMVTTVLDDGKGRKVPNIAADATKAIGAPQGGVSDVVAIGVRGAYIVLDLGEKDAATDGKGGDIVVLEFGSNTGGTPEPYRVKVANAPAGPFTTLGDGRGEKAFDLNDAKLSQARYVRVESLVPASEIFGGLGSTFYPGPELDAVGAVFPASAK